MPVGSSSNNPKADFYLETRCSSDISSTNPISLNYTSESGIIAKGAPVIASLSVTLDSV